MEIRLADGDPRVAVVCVGGDVDAAGAEELQAAVVAALARAGPVAGDLILDLSGVEFMGSAGLSSLLHLRSLLRRAGRALRVVEPSPPVRRLLEITGTAADLRAPPDVGTGDPPPVQPARVSPERRSDPPGADRRA